MGLLQAVVRFPYTTNLPRDVSINTFNFEVPGDYTQAQADAIHAALVAFYNTVAPTVAVCSMMSTVIQRNACKVQQFYKSAPDNSDFGDPVQEVGFTLGAAGTTINLPLEVALCASESSQDAPSRATGRSRQYIGPLCTNAMNNGAGFPTPSSFFITALANASDRLCDAMAVNDTPWVVWSRKNSALYTIDSGYVNNEWDTQRRREADATARTIWTNLV